MLCPECNRSFEGDAQSCPYCGAAKGVVKTSTILISAGGMRSVYRSVEEVPDSLKRQLIRSTNGLNSATLVIADRLSNSPTERAKIASYAKQVETHNGSSIISKELKGATLSFLGWARSSSSDPRRAPQDGGEWLLKLMGLAMTAIAASLGAPFWFDVLSKIMTVRSGGDPPPPKQEAAPAKTETHEEGAKK